MYGVLGWISVRVLVLMASYVVGALFAGCGKDRSIQGFEFVDDDKLGDIQRLEIDRVEIEESFTYRTNPTGFSTRLSLGSLEGIETHMLLRFPNIPDSTSIASANILLFSPDEIKVGTSGLPFRATVHRITSDWDESNVTFESFGSAFDAGVLGEVEVTPVNREVDADTVIVDTLRIPMNQDGLDLITALGDTTSGLEDFGMMVTFENSNFVKGFFSREIAPSAPRLELVYQVEDAVPDTIFRPTDADAFIARDDIGVVEGPLYVDHVFGHVSVLKFNLDAVPKESTVNRAILRLVIQDANSLLSNTIFSFQANRLSEPFTGSEDSSQVVGVDAVIGFITSTSDTVQVNVSNFVQRWILGPSTGLGRENFGVLLQTDLTGSVDISRVAFHSDANNPELGPKLQIDFTTAPSLK